MAPEVYADTFGSAPGYPSLTVLDSTHPEAVRAVSGNIDPARTLFLVASKSGGTIETLSLFRHFWKVVSEARDRPGHHFVAVTDPGSGLEALAGERQFRRVFAAPPDVGGRYSALTVFGLLPAALIGADIGSLLGAAAHMADHCGPDRPATTNPGLRLGAVMGEAARAGRDKITYICSPAVAGFASWVEQLIAESTGKDGTGLVPVAGEPLGDPASYGSDRLFVFLALEGDQPPGWQQARAGLGRRGHPVVEVTLNVLEELGAEMFRSEMAVASAGSVLGINPFDQPDVQVAKELARRAMSPEGLDGAIAEISSDSDRLAGELSAWAGDGRAGGLHRRPRLPPHGRCCFACSGSAGPDAEGSAPGGGHARLRAPVSPLDRPAPQGRPQPGGVPPAGGPTAAGHRCSGGRLQLRGADRGPGGR